MLRQLTIEVRYKSTPNLFDSRSEIINQSKKYFKNWMVSGISYLEVRDKDRKIRGTVSTKNSGVTMSDPQIGVFKDTSTTFLKNTFETINIKAEELKRLGVRSKFAIPYDGSFGELIKVFKERLFKIDDEKMPSDFKIVDVGVLLDLEVNDKKCHVSLGPMEKQQLEDYLPESDSLPEVGVYVDIDYYKDDLQNKYNNFNVIRDYLNEGIEKNQEFVTNIKSILNL